MQSQKQQPTKQSTSTTTTKRDQPKKKRSSKNLVEQADLVDEDGFVKVINPKLIKRQQHNNSNSSKRAPGKKPNQVPVRTKENHIVNFIKLIFFICAALLILVERNNLLLELNNSY